MTAWNAKCAFAPSRLTMSIALTDKSRICLLAVKRRIFHHSASSGIHLLPIQMKQQWSWAATSGLWLTLAQKILKSSGQAVYRSTVRSFMPDEIVNNAMKREKEKFTESVEKTLGDSFKFEDCANNPELSSITNSVRRQKSGVSAWNIRMEAHPENAWLILRSWTLWKFADYAILHQGIDDEPAFAWWVPYTLRWQNCTNAAVNKQYHKRTHKFGIKYTEDLRRIDKANGNLQWQEAIQKEMNMVALMVASKVLGDNKSPPPTF